MDNVDEAWRKSWSEQKITWNQQIESWLPACPGRKIHGGVVMSKDYPHFKNFLWNQFAVQLLLKLLWRNFCRKTVEGRFSNFHTQWDPGLISKKNYVKLSNQVAGSFLCWKITWIQRNESVWWHEKKAVISGDVSTYSP